MNFDLWAPRQRIELAYKSALHNLIDRFVMKLPGLDLTSPYDIVSSLNKFAMTDIFKEYAYAAASKMILGLFSDQGETWKEAARENMQGRMIYELLNKELQGPVGDKVRQLIAENAQLISTFPLNISEQVTAYIQRESLKGRRSEDITRDLVKQFPDVTRSRLNLIARTETSKASTALTRARSENMGLAWYAWRTSKDARVRHSHNVMDRVLVRFDDPPSPEALAREKRTYGNYHAGEIFNCRCYPAPVINLNLIKWPSKVHMNGSIQHMTRHQFESLNNSGLRKAA